MRIFVLGGAHFPAFNVCLSLAQRYTKNQFLILDNIPAKRTELKRTVGDNPQFSLWEGSAADENLLKNLMNNADVLINFIDAEDIEDYVKEVSNLFEYAKSSHLERIIHISSSKVYGEAEESPLIEDHPLKPTELKGVLDTFGENLAYYYSRKYDLPVIILRVFNLYGPYQPLTYTVPFLLANALKDQPLPLREEGEWAENLLFVEDFSEAISKILEAKFDALRGEVINIGGLGDVPESQIAEIILSRLDKPQSLIAYQEKQKKNPSAPVPSIMKARILLSWAPKVEIDEGLNKTIDWYLKNREWWDS